MTDTEKKEQQDPAAPPVPEETPAAAAPQEAEKHAPGRGAWLMALLLAVAALAATAWQWHDGRQQRDALRQEVAGRLAAADQQSRQGRDVAEQVRQGAGATEARIAALENKLAESQGQQIALESLYQDLSRSRDEWTFAEIEQSLLIANQQLQLAGNVKAALIALQSADGRLQHMDRPQLAGLRKAINRDVERLKALPYVDTVGISARLENLIVAADQMPLAMEVRPQATPAEPGDAAAAGPWERFWRQAWAELRQLVRIQRVEKPDLALLAPEQSFFLRENLKLRLLGARIALLSRDEKSFRDDLAAARAALERYFDTRDSRVAQALVNLDNLRGSDINIEVPDISATLEVVRNLRLPRERGQR